MFTKSKLAKAIAANDRDKVDRILERYPELINEPLDNHVRPLSIAIGDNHIDMAAQLVARGARVSEAGHHGPNMLFDALHHDHLVLVKAWAQDNRELLLARSVFGTSLLHVAAKSNNVPALHWLLQEGLDVEALDNRSRTPLQLAELYANEQAIAVLRPYQEKANLQHKRQAQKLVIREEGDEKWTKLDDNRIAQVQHLPEIGYRVTAIFNFATGERTRIYRNVETDQESAETTTFDVHAPSADALEAFEKLQPARGQMQRTAPAAAILKRTT